MLDYNQIKERAYIIMDNTPYEVLSSHIARKQKQKPVNQTKLRNLLVGGVKEHTFHISDKVQEADISKKKMVYLFSKENRQTNSIEYWFVDKNDRSARIMLPKSLIENSLPYIKENDEVDILVWTDLDEEPNYIGVKIPIKVELEVTDAPPAVAGNTATGATKIVELETGLKVTTPLFVNTGDIVRVNTETGEYVERA